MIEKQTIRHFLAKLTNKEIQIGDDDSLVATRLLDSLNITQLIVFLESEFKVSFSSDELIPDNLDTINSIVRLLERKGIS